MYLPYDYYRNSERYADPTAGEAMMNVMLEQKKQHYEEILRRELDGLDDEFETLRLLSQELSVRANGLRFRKAA